MLKSKKMIMLAVVMLIMGLVIGVMNSEVKATSDNPIDISGSVGGSDVNAQIEANQVTANQIAANQMASNSQVIQPVANTDSNTTGNTLPQTGVTEDITVMFFIVVCIISAIYAYKKIRDYRA